MLNKFTLSFLILASVTLTACAVDGGSIRTKDGHVEVYSDHDRYDYPSRKHCPPGHAKKGWC